MHFDPERVRLHARRAETEDLLDQVTFFRGEMEPVAVDIFEAELAGRGVYQRQIEMHSLSRQAKILRSADGTVIRCSFCPRPAVDQGWGWHRLWGWFIPLFPRYFYYCAKHFENPPTDSHGRALHFDPER